MTRDRVDALDQRVKRLRAAIDALDQEHDKARTKVELIEEHLDDQSSSGGETTATEPARDSISPVAGEHEASDEEVAAAVRAVEGDRPLEEETDPIPL